MQHFQAVSKSYEPNYTCGLCDACVEELNFTRDSRIPPKGTVVEEELQRELEEAFLTGHFDYYQLKRLCNAYRNNPKAMYRRSRGILEGSPNNLVALYFCREFSPEDEKGANTKRLIRTANDFLPLETIIQIYHFSDASFKKSQLLILNDEYGKFNNEKGMKWLYEEAKKRIESRL